MATRWAAATGNWSAVGTWDGGTTLPQAGDTVYADGKTVTIDQDITVTQITNTTRSGGTANGSFAVSANTTRTLNCNIVAGTVNCLAITATGGGVTITLNGNITGPSAAVNGVTSTGTCALVITGSVTGGSNTGGNAVYQSGNGTLTQSGGNLVATGCCIITSTTAAVSITGNLTQAASSVIGGCLTFITNRASSCTITGNITADYAFTLVEGTLATNFSIVGTMTANVNTYLVNDTALTSACNITTSSHAVGIISKAQSGTVTIGGDCKGCNLAHNPTSVSISGNIAVHSIINVDGLTLSATSGTLTHTGDITADRSTFNGLNISSNASAVITGTVTSSSSGSTASGIKIQGTGNLTVNGNVVNSGTASTSIGIQRLSSGTLTVKGNLTNSNGAGATYGAIYSTGSGTITIGDGSNNYTLTPDVGYGIQTTSTANVVFYGTVKTPTASTKYGIYSTGANAITVNGNVTISASGSTNCANIYSSNASGTITVNGSCYGSTVAGGASVASAMAVQSLSSSATAVTINGDVINYDTNTGNGVVSLQGTGKVIVTGDVTGGSIAAAYAITNLTTAGEIDLTGTSKKVTGGSNATAYAIYSTLNTTIVDCQAEVKSNACPAIYLSGTTPTLKVRGKITIQNYIFPVYTAVTNSFKVDPSATQTTVLMDTAGANRTFSAVTGATGNPAITDVRAGTVYGPTSNLTGTLIMAVPSDVAKNVPTDNTVGTHTGLSAADIWNCDTSLITAGIGVIAKQQETHQGLGNLIVALRKT